MPSMQESLPHTSPRLNATYFDGRSAQSHAVELHIADALLHIHGTDVNVKVALRDVQWPERTRYGKRMAQLKAGGLVQCDDGDAWDTWGRASGLGESAVVVWQQSWRWVAAAVVAFVALLVGFQQWGLPLAARGIVAMMPLSVDASLGARSLKAIDDTFMAPTALPPEQQASIRQAFAQALSAQPPERVPAWNLEFRKSKIGPNALALPGGTLLLTDELVELVDGDTRVLTAVLAHELGHVQQRHGLRMVVQASALAAVAGVVLGDFSTLLAALPALMGQAHYSRTAEREADAHAREVLTAAHIPPSVMVTLFDKLKTKRAQDQEKARTEAKAGPQDSEEAARTKRIGTAISWLGIAFASHPADAERVAFFQETAP